MHISSLTAQEQRVSEQSGYRSIKVLNTHHLGGEERISDISALLLPSGNGGERKTAACI